MSGKIAAYVRDTHYIGGVKHPRGKMLNGWPCCCSGDRVRRISRAPLTYVVSEVTCKGCIRVMRKSDELRRQIDGVPTELWTGPREDDLATDGVSLVAPVPDHRWPYGPPNFHETCCRLHRNGLYCDCKASDASDAEFGGAP